MVGVASLEHFYEAGTGPTRCGWTGSVVDLVFGSNSQLRAISEVYASDDGPSCLFVILWPLGTVMNLGRFD